MDFWIEINKLKGQTLKTLDQNKSFDVVELTQKAVIVRPHKNKTERIISRDEIESAYKKLVAARELTRTEIRLEFSHYHAGYIAAILAALPSVQHSIRPILLRI